MDIEKILLIFIIIYVVIAIIFGILLLFTSYPIHGMVCVLFGIIVSIQGFFLYQKEKQ